MQCFLFARSLGGVPIDVVLREAMTTELEIAEHPIERGSPVSDHAWLLPAKIEIEGVVDGPAAIAAYEALLALQEAREPFDFLSGFRLWPNMLLKKLTPTRDSEHGRVLKFEAELQEVIIVSTQESPAAEPGNGGDERNAKPFRRGQVQARKVTEPSIQSRSEEMFRASAPAQ